MKNILLTGVGGQGTVLAAKILAQTALDRNCAVRSTETIGMAQRGGSVVSHVRLASGKGESIASPLIPKGGADVIIAFEPGEALRTLDYLAPGGTLVTCSNPVPPVTQALAGKSYDGAAELEYLRGLAAGEAGEAGEAKSAPRIGCLVAVDGETACQQVGSTKALNVVLLAAACATGKLGIKPEQLQRALEKQVKPQFLEMNRKALEVGAGLADMTV